MNNVHVSTCVMLVFLALLGGCLPAAQNEPSKFYLLRSLTNPQSEPGAAKISLGVGPVVLPQYLDRPQIVTQTAGNELNINEFNRWAETLQDNFTRVLANDIGLLLDTDQVFPFPWGGSVSIDYQVKMEVTRFIGQLGGESSLVARWSIIGENGTKTLLSRRSQITAVARDPGYEALVTAMNETVAHLSRDIAGAIQQLLRK